MMIKDTSPCAHMFHGSSKLSRRNDRKQHTQKLTLNRLRAATFEVLEGRTLMSSVALSNGLLTIQGDSSHGSNLSATLVNSGKSILADAGEGHTLTVSRSLVRKIDVTGGSGSDTITVDLNLVLPTTITGGEGHDVIWGSGGRNDISVANGNDWINVRGPGSYVQAGNGNDSVYGSYGSDTIWAGNGNDFVAGQDGNDFITVGNGHNSVSDGSGNDKLTIGAGTTTVTLGSGTDSVVAASRNTTVIGAGRGDSIALGGSSTPVSAPVSTPVINTPTTTPMTPPVASPPVSTPVANPTPAPAEAISDSIGTTSWTTYQATSVSAGGVRAVMQVLAPAPTVGIAIVVRALNSTLGAGTAIDANYQWNFGDTHGAFNTLPGFNAAHIYNTPGTYPITLTVTNYLHQSSTVSMNITISPDTRRLIYVDSVHGSDNNSALTPGSAIRTATRASQLVNNNTEVLFDRGETFNLAQTFKLNYKNVMVTAYGSGALPVINYTLLVSGGVIFSTNSGSAVGVTLSNVNITTLNGTQPNAGNLPMGFMAGGYATSVVGCTFGYVQYDINGSPSPLGLTVENNSSPINGALKGYFIWDQGSDTTVLGNYVNGSQNEHVFRSVNSSELLIDGNNFSNFDGKGCIEVHVGGNAWIDGNTINGGDIRTGPLGLWNEPLDATVNCVIQNNTITGNNIQVYPGSIGVAIRDNIITRAGKQLIDVIGSDTHGRVSANIQIVNNTGIDTVSTGNFLKVENHTNGITLQNNLFIDSSLAVGGYNTAPVYVSESNLSSFSFITGNVWQQPIFYAWARGGINFIGTSYISAGYQTASAWNSYANVGTDYFSTTPLNAGSYIPKAGSLASTAATPVVGNFSNIYGTARATTGTWAAGAV